MTTVITACYGGYETVLPDLSKQTVPVDRKILVTGDGGFGAQNRLFDQAVQDGWEVVYEPRPHLHPNVAAKLPKFMPWLYVGIQWWEPTVWMDANTIAGPQLVELAVKAAKGGDGIAQFPHPLRDCILDEADETLRLVAAGESKYVGLPVEQQVAHYVKWGMPAHFGLWATGVIGYAAPLGQLGGMWMQEVVRWGFQDQLSQPYVLWCLNMKPNPIARDLWVDKDLVWFRPHGG